ncbi:hypothetical protein GGI00_005202, partial [Coemansia sp. RSA 2681]
MGSTKPTQDPSPLEEDAGSVTEQFGMVDISRAANLLLRFDHKPGDQDATGIMEWLTNTRRLLKELGVPAGKWRMVTCMKMRADVVNRYYAWTEENEDYRLTWEGLEEFLVQYYIGTSSELDAFMRAMAHRLALTEGEIDKSLTTLRSLVELTNIKTTQELLIKMTVAKLPRPVMLQLLGRPDGLRGLKLDDIGLVLRQYVASRKTATRGEPMEVDAVDGDEEWDELPSAHANAIGQRVTRRPGKPAESKSTPARRLNYDMFKAWVTRDEYDRRVADNLCLGCDSLKISTAAQFVIGATVCGKPVRALVDNGCQTTLINAATCKELRLATRALGKRLPLRLANGAPLGDSDHVAIVPLMIADGLVEEVECAIAPIAYDVILGNSWLVAHDAELHAAQHRLRMRLDGEQHWIYATTSDRARTPNAHASRQQQQSST